jgi:hypothetical protein
MVKWEAWVERMSDIYVVLIRNHKTSHGLVAFSTKTDADRQAAKINNYPFARKVELYKEAMRKNIVCKKHDELNFEDTRLKPISIEKGEGCYAIAIWIDGNQYIVAKKKFKKDATALLKEWLLEHTEAELIAFFRVKIQRKKRAEIHSLRHV